MKQKISKILIGVLVLIIIAIFIYLWFMVTIWAISFLVTVIAVAAIVMGLFKFKHWLQRKKENGHLERRNANREIIERRSNL